MSGWAPNWGRLTLNGRNLGIFKISFSTIWLNSTSQCNWSLKKNRFASNSPNLVPTMRSLSLTYTGLNCKSKDSDSFFYSWYQTFFIIYNLSFVNKTYRKLTSSEHWFNYKFDYKNCKNDGKNTFIHVTYSIKAGYILQYLLRPQYQSSMWPLYRNLCDYFKSY